MKYYQVEIIIRETKQDSGGYSKITRETISQNMNYYHLADAYKDAILALQAELESIEPLQELKEE